MSGVTSYRGRQAGNLFSKLRSRGGTPTPNRGRSLRSAPALACACAFLLTVREREGTVDR